MVTGKAMRVGPSFLTTVSSVDKARQFLGLSHISSGKAK